MNKQYSPGDKVWSKHYGCGKITAIGVKYVFVIFEFTYDAYGNNTRPIKCSVTDLYFHPQNEFHDQHPQNEFLNINLENYD